MSNIIKAFLSSIDFSHISVYYKALAYSTTVSGRGSNQKFIEASSLNKGDFKVYPVKDYFNLPLSKSHDN